MVLNAILGKATNPDASIKSKHLQYDQLESVARSSSAEKPIDRSLRADHAYLAIHPHVYMADIG
jgi:hypothetical protein